jgi:chemotaxis signal transduction protein
MEIQGQQDAQLIGVLVDAVNTVLELEAAEIEPSHIWSGRAFRLHSRHGQTGFSWIGDLY